MFHVIHTYFASFVPSLAPPDETAGGDPVVMSVSSRPCYWPNRANKKRTESDEVSCTNIFPEDTEVRLLFPEDQGGACDRFSDEARDETDDLYTRPVKPSTT